LKGTTVDGLLSNFFFLSFLAWPVVVLLAAGANMLISWTFSWQELVIDAMIGFVIGMCFYFGTAGPPKDIDAAKHFFLTASIGLFGLLKWLGVETFQDVSTLFWASAISIVGATAACAGLDRVAVQVIGRESSVCNGLFSLLVFGLKAPFGLFTTVVGTAIGIIGLFVACANKADGGFGFIGGVVYTQWGLSGKHATTFSSYVNVFKGPVKNVIDHELYHTRQYIYMQDWLGVVFFTVGAIWGLISSAAAKGNTFDAAHAFRADGDVGNPIEVAAYKLDWT
jgi:hypothetical protein